MPDDPSFQVNSEALTAALAALKRPYDAGTAAALPKTLPEDGLGDEAALAALAPHVLGGAAPLDAPDAFAHMDPPTPWITWATALWNARLNQNLLHPATSPFARQAESRVMAWLAPEFHMTGGHMTPGSSLANLTALWAARDAGGVHRVVASAAAHLSFAKAARILGLAYETVPTDDADRMDLARLGDVSDACLVLTAGSTSSGAIDPLHATGRAAWTHVDAAWGGPLYLSPQYRHRLEGMEAADSIVISAHKWLFQPKESALVLFRDVDRANKAISFDSPYLAVPNVGLLGSHGAMAIPLLATLLAWGKQGLASRIERCMAAASQLAALLSAEPRLVVFAPPETGVLLFRPRNGEIPAAMAALVPRTASQTTVKGVRWMRCVPANPLADIEAIAARILETLPSE